MGISLSLDKNLKHLIQVGSNTKIQAAQLWYIAKQSIHIQLWPILTRMAMGQVSYRSGKPEAAPTNTYPTLYPTCEAATSL